MVLGTSFSRCSPGLSQGLWEIMGAPLTWQRVAGCGVNKWISGSFCPLRAHISSSWIPAFLPPTELVSLSPLSFYLYLVWVLSTSVIWYGDCPNSLFSFQVISHQAIRLILITSLAQQHQRLNLQTFPILCPSCSAPKSSVLSFPTAHRATTLPLLCLLEPSQT